MSPLASRTGRWCVGCADADPAVGLRMRARKGSEQEVGLRIMLAAAQRHDVWVLTRENSIPLLEEYLALHPL
jgi:hypothetical protein